MSPTVVAVIILFNTMALLLLCEQRDDMRGGHSPGVVAPEHAHYLLGA